MQAPFPIQARMPKAIELRRHRAARARRTAAVPRNRPQLLGHSERASGMTGETTSTPHCASCARKPASNLTKASCGTPAFTSILPRKDLHLFIARSRPIPRSTSTRALFNALHAALWHARDSGSRRVSMDGAGRGARAMRQKHDARTDGARLVSRIRKGLTSEAPLRRSARRLPRVDRLPAADCCCIASISLAEVLELGLSIALRTFGNRFSSSSSW